MKGVNHTATIYRDDLEIAQHYNAYTSFEVIAKNLTPGTHTLKIKADNRFSKDSALHIPNDYMSYGGINRPVVLESIGKAYITHLQVTPFYKNNQWNTTLNFLFCT